MAVPTRLSLVMVIGLPLFLVACQDDGAKAFRAKQEIQIQSQVLMNKADVPRDQAAFDKMTAVAGCPEDPWGHPYVYERLGVRKIRISSMGRDGKLGTADDVPVELTFPSGSGLEELTIARPDGSSALKSPDGKHTFWVDQKSSGDNEVTELWIGDSKAAAAKPMKSDSLDSDWRRSVSLTRWSKDGRFLDLKDVVTPSRPDGSATKESRLLIDVAGAKVVGTSQVPSDASAWMEY